ncbi:tyrosine-type recombinase/integrase [Aminobacterium colombiense]|jgi:integrase/recombinase XerC|uniref:tyrosine-type recombinase/integrase n=1 Tax=Aminobacterium colombiense TaxID=81468 RepID=UPI0025970786|nr:tyrosine-type recombinase/integrase [uncultured Aminobacterium sp.]
MKGPETTTPTNGQTGKITQEFLSALAANEDLQQKTINEYGGDLRHFISWAQGSGQLLRIQDVAIPTLTRYREWMQNEMTLKPATINRRLITLKRFFEWAHDHGHTTFNPAKPIRLVPEEKTSPRQMTDKEEASLVAAAAQGGNLRDYAIIVLMLHTGLREMEVCNLRPEDLHIGAKSGHVIVRSGKRHKQRQAPLNATARATLNKYLASGQNGQFLFPSLKTGDRLSERGVRYMIQKYMKKANVSGLSAHDLRHRFGYLMAKKVPLHRLAQIMGHNSLNTTMIYVQATQEDLQEEVEKIKWE